MPGLPRQIPQPPSLSAPTSTSQPAPLTPKASLPERPVPAWLNEGVAQFIGTLWEEKQHGRDSALRMLEADRAALALAEPASPGQSPGQPLASRHLARLLPHQGRLRPLDAPRPRRRPRPLRRPPRLLRLRRQSEFRQFLHHSRHSYSRRRRLCPDGQSLRKTPRSLRTPTPTSPGSSPIGSMPTRACPTSPSRASFPPPPRPATGWSPSTCPTPATQPPKFQSPSAPARVPTLRSVTQRLRVPARGKTTSASSSRASPPRSRSTTAPSPKPRPASTSPNSKTPHKPRPAPANPTRQSGKKEVICFLKR